MNLQASTVVKKNSLLTGRNLESDQVYILLKSGWLKEEKKRDTGQIE